MIALRLSTTLKDQSKSLAAPSDRVAALMSYTWMLPDSLTTLLRFSYSSTNKSRSNLIVTLPSRDTDTDLGTQLSSSKKENW